MLLGTIAGTGVVSFAPAIEALTKYVHNDPRDHALILWTIIGGLFLVNAVANAASYGSSYLSAWSGQRFIADLRVRLLGHALRLPVAEYDEWRPGELLTRFTNDLALMTDAMSVSLPQLVQVTVTFIVSLAYMIYTDWLLTLGLLIAAPIVSFTVSRFTGLIAANTQITQARVSDLTSNLSEVLHAQRIVKAFRRESFETERFKETNERFFGAYLKMTQMTQTQVPIVGMIMVVTLLAIIAGSANEVIVGRMNGDSVFRFWTLVALSINPINRIAGYVGDLSRSMIGVARIYEVLDLPVEDDTVTDPSESRRLAGELVFDSVSFAYPKTSLPVLSNFSARIAAGSVVAFVGPSGAGKTTIASLIPRFYDVTAGQILIDGAPLRELSLSTLRNAIGIVPQDPQLFHGTIADNIRYGRLDASPDEIARAAREANAEEFIKQLPDGYQTFVGERGTRLSGGQRQRIAIARAILRDPRILILDEATSALDTHSERLIEEALDTLLAGRTTIIIAHRLSTIRRANNIFYLDKGTIRETGTHTELLASGGHYADLFNAQFS